MFLVREIRKRARHIAGPVLAIAVFGYFAYHSVQGDRGLIAWVHLSQQVEVAETALEKISRERQALEQRANLLRPDNLDPDLLDERARQVLSVVRPDEVVILDKGSSFGSSDEGDVPQLMPAPRRPQDTPVHFEQATPPSRSKLTLADVASRLSVSFAPAR